MYNVLSDEEKVNRGDRAGSLLAAESFHEVIQALQESLHGGLDSMPIHDQKAIMDIVYQIRAVKSIPGKLEGWAQEAKMITKNGERR